MKSMTGYGSSEGKVGKGRIFIETKSINHRYCEMHIKIPPKMTSIEIKLRNLIKNNVERGKVDLFLKERKEVTKGKDLVLNLSLARKYHKCLKNLDKELGFRSKEVHLLEVIDARELITIEDLDVDYSRYWPQIKKIVLDSLKKLNQMREHEGRYLLRDQKKRLGSLSRIRGRTKKRIKIVINKERKKCERKLKKISNYTNGRERMDAEVASILDKMDITEELTRLDSHIGQYHKILSQRGAIGRRLDFLLQEMNREVNTIGSKAGDSLISRYIINAKNELEKLREQAQNIE